VRQPLLPATPDEVAALAADLALAGLAPAPLDV
jgi:4-hydroxy-tetrahydrodipicolinate synthase